MNLRERAEQIEYFRKWMKRQEEWNRMANPFLHTDAVERIVKEPLVQINSEFTGDDSLEPFEVLLSNELDADQRMAIELSKEKNVAVYAGPGSGKTRCLVERVKDIVADIPYEQILGVTFTTAAAREMNVRTRLPVRFSTLHSLAYHICRTSHLIMKIVPEELVRKLFLEFCTRDTSKPDLHPDEIFNIWVAMKRRYDGYPFSIIGNPFEELEKLDKDIAKRLCAEAMAETLEMMKLNSWYTYDDMIVAAINLIEMGKWQSKYKDISVDEAHDLNGLEWAFLDKLAGSDTRLFLLASPEQAIYSFRNASNDRMVKFIEDHEMQVVRLKRNYRSARSIVRFSNRIFDISEPVLRAVGSVYLLPHYSDPLTEAIDVVNKVKPQLTNAIIFRVNALSIPVIDALISRNLRFRLIKNFLESNIYKFVRNVMMIKQGLIEHGSSDYLWACRYLKMNPEQFDEFVRLLPFDPSACLQMIESAVSTALMTDEDPQFALRMMQTISQKYPTISSFLSFMDTARSMNDDDSKIVLGSIHSVKGLEFDIVFIIGAVDGILPHRKGDIEEETRIFYVGITRAKRRVYISSSKIRGYENRSPFIDKLGLKSGKNYDYLSIVE